MKASIILNSTDTGWYDDSGFHDSANTNYIAGDLSANEHRDFFVFDLTGIAGSIVSAQLSLFNPGPPFPGYSSPNPSETYQLTNVTTATTTLVSSNTGATAIFSDLGTNTLYGSQSVSSADDGQRVVITLDSAAIEALNTAIGLLAFGGRITGLPSPPSGPNRYIFGFTDGPGPNAQLIVTTPEQPSLPLIGAALLGLVALRVHRKRLMAH